MVQTPVWFLTLRRVPWVETDKFSSFSEGPGRCNSVSCLWFSRQPDAPTSFLSGEAFCILASDHPFLAHQTPSLVSPPRDCLSFSDPVLFSQPLLAASLASAPCRHPPFLSVTRPIIFPPHGRPQLSGSCLTICLTPQATAQSTGAQTWHAGAPGSCPAPHGPLSLSQVRPLSITGCGPSPQEY